jgi:predicted nucleic acid-binding protein
LDTSVISHLDQKDAPALMAETHRLWERIKADEFEVVISDVAVAEISKCKEPKKSTLFEYVGQIKYTAVDTADNDKVNAITGHLIALVSCVQKALTIAST